MNNECAAKMASAGQLIGRNECAVMHNPTLAENIEQRINMLETQVERLKNVKAKLATGNMLDVPIDDLRFAMNY